MALNLVSYLQAYTICFSPITHFKTKRLMNLLYFILLGALAGWLAGQIMKGSGYGAIVNIILGIVGGLVGGWLFGQLGVSAGGGLSWPKLPHNLQFNAVDGTFSDTGKSLQEPCAEPP